MTLALMLATVKIAEGEVSTVYAPPKPLQLNDHFFSQETAPAFSNRTKAYTSSSGEKERISRYIKEVFGEAGEEAVKIAVCESNLRPEAINWGDAEITGMPSHGIFQLNMPYNEALFDWKTNVDIAYKDFYLKRGFQPWSCARILGIK